MKNSEDHIDKLFSDNLETQAFDIPTDFINDLNNRLDLVAPAQGKRRGGIFFFWLNGVFLLIFLSLSFTDQMTTHTLRTAHSNVKLMADTVISSQGLNAETETDKIEDEFNKLIEVDVNKESSNGAEKANVISKSEKTVINDAPKSDDLLSDKKSKSAPGQKQIARDAGAQLPIATNPSDANSSGVSGNSKLLGKNIEENLPPDTLFIRDTVIVYDTVRLVDTLRIVDTVRVPTIETVQTKDAADWSLELAMGAGFNYGAERLTTNSFQGGTHSIAERAIVTPAFGVDLNFNRNNYSIGTGVRYFETGERYQVNSSTITQIDTVEIVDYQFDTVVFNQQTQQFDSIYTPIYDSVSYFDTLNSVQDWTNSYAWLSIPVSFGYRFDVGKWALIPRLGVSLNIGISNASGDYPSISGTDLVVTSAAPVTFNMDYLLQLEIRRKLQKAELFISPCYRGNLIPMISNSPVRKFQSIGLSFGVVVNL